MQIIPHFGKLVLQEVLGLIQMSSSVTSASCANITIYIALNNSCRKNMFNFLHSATD